MGLQIAAISKRYMMQMQKTAAARAAAGQAESSVQMGMNLQKMLENRKAAAAESLALFGTENPQTSRRSARRRAICSLCAPTPRRGMPSRRFAPN